MSIRRSIAVLAAVCALVATPAFAQSGSTASLSGLVTDKDGGVSDWATHSIDITPAYQDEDGNVIVSGLSELPSAGDKFFALDDFDRRRLPVKLREHLFSICVFVRFHKFSPAVIRGMTFLDRDERSAAGRANLLAGNQFGFDDRFIVG